MEKFLETKRIGFSTWKNADYIQAETLWGNKLVTKYICASGAFTPGEIRKRLETEVSNEEKYGVQYWPIYTIESGQFLGCCGLRPHGDQEYEIGFHLCPEHWGQGYAKEAAEAVIAYAFNELHAKALFAGHNPNNMASKGLLQKLGFRYIGDEYYAPTGLYHPSYTLQNQEKL